jgi:hypothetical protein
MLQRRTKEKKERKGDVASEEQRANSNTNGNEVKLLHICLSRGEDRGLPLFSSYQQNTWAEALEAFMIENIYTEGTIEVL